MKESEKWSVKFNRIELVGNFVCEPYYSHSFQDILYYKGYFQTKRSYGIADTLIVNFPQSLLHSAKRSGQKRILGKIESRNYLDSSEKAHTSLYVSAEQICPINETDSTGNEAVFNGFICKPPILRSTPRGRRIAEVMVSAYKGNSQRSFIPCIFWDDRATQISSFDVGTMLHITGRLQSREYRKKMPDDTQEIKVTYELSVCRYGILAPPKNRTERVG